MKLILRKEIRRMDEMKIETTFIKNVMAKLMRKRMSEKFGCDANIRLKALNVSVTDKKAYVHLNVDAEMDAVELMKLFKSIGL